MSLITSITQTRTLTHIPEYAQLSKCERNAGRPGTPAFRHAGTNSHTKLRGGNFVWMHGPAQTELACKGNEAEGRGESILTKLTNNLFPNNNLFYPRQLTTF